jgi:glycosyltransferase involved in cell wall biosynthesis
MRITVVLCTYNRVRSLATALESIATQTVPQSVGWEILVVDNNSSDETRQVVEDFQRRYPKRIRYLFEPQQGLSYARNAGIRDSRSDILAFIDDDETASTDWLQNLTANLLGGEWAGAGGRVLPQWNGSRPRWLSAKGSFALGPLAVFDPGLEAGLMTVPPVGANMAFRKEAFDKYGEFRTDLGRAGKNLLSNEDIELGRRLMNAGERLRYEPLAVTYHPVEETRARREYFLAWWFNKGRSDVLESGIQSSRKHVLGIPLRLFRDFVVETVRWIASFDPSQRFVSKLKVWCYAGQAFESYAQALRARRRRVACND